MINFQLCKLQLVQIIYNQFDTFQNWWMMTMTTTTMMKTTYRILGSLEILAIKKSKTKDFVMCNKEIVNLHYAFQ